MKNDEVIKIATESGEAIEAVLDDFPEDVIKKVTKLRGQRDEVLKIITDLSPTELKNYYASIEVIDDKVKIVTKAGETIEVPKSEFGDELFEKVFGGTGKVYTGGRTQAELDDLAKDPSHGFKIEEQGLKEREIGLALEERGDLGKIVRDAQIDKGAEFIDETTGIKWDVKSFESYPSGDNGVPITSPKKGAFTIQRGIKKIQREFKNGNNVIIDTRKLVPEHIEQLKKAIDEAGIADRIIWYP